MNIQPNEQKLIQFINEQTNFCKGCKKNLPVDSFQVTVDTRVFKRCHKCREYERSRLEYQKQYNKDQRWVMRKYKLQEKLEAKGVDQETIKKTIEVLMKI